MSSSKEMNNGSKESHTQSNEISWGIFTISYKIFEYGQHSNSQE